MLEHAVVLLGFNAVRNAIVSVSIINALPKNILFQDFEMGSLLEAFPGSGRDQQKYCSKSRCGITGQLFCRRSAARCRVK